MKRLAIILLLFMLLPLVGKGQAIWQWATDANSANSEIARDLAVDATNDFVYVVGEWNGNLEGDFGAGAGPLNFTTTYGNKDGFIAKYDLNGTLIWAFKVGSSNDDCVTGVSVGPSGNIYVTGYFTGLGEFEGISPGVPGSITSAGGRDIFQAAYNPAGQLLWVFDNGGTGDDEGTAVATNSSGVYFTGSYTASAAIGGFGSNSNLGGDEIFVNKRSFTGISQWLIDGASDGDDVGNDLVANETNVFLIGNFSGATIGYFDAGSGASSTIANSSSGTNDITLLSIDEGSGNLVWHQTIGSSLDDFGNGITLDTDGFYCTGATNVNPNFPTLGTVGGQNAQDIFVSGHNLTNGSTNWAFSEVGNGADIAHGISSNQFGELFVSGEYDGTTDFSGDINTTTGADDIFISKYTNTGTFGWVQTAGNTNEDRALSITTYQANVAFICGEFRNNSDFDPLPALTGDATSDLFTARLDECDGTFSYSSATFCSNETNPTPTVNGSSPGTFTAPADVSFISATTGEINLTASTPGGPYTITYTPACGTPATFDVTILPTDDPSFTYTATSYCENDDNPIPTITGTTGGTFSGPAEITFVNPLTGEIDISSSTLGGPYTIVYTTPGPACPNTATFDLTLLAVQDPTFGYPSDTYCLDGSKITPTISGVAGGFFGASSFSIDIDGSTGEIDLDPVMSGPGTYWIYYMPPGPICPGVDSFEITLLTPDDPSFTYPSPICITGENPFQSLLPLLVEHFLKLHY
ncbi:MAG: hypothetical protein MI810_01275 [Flavobacteriales bacterium]|nr:hypothetical protein [Flavobacteriales bacterium]